MKFITIITFLLLLSLNVSIAQPGPGSITKKDVNISGCECELFRVYFDITIVYGQPATRFSYYWVAKPNTDKDCIIKLHPSLSLKIELPDQQFITINDEFNEEQSSGETNRLGITGSPDWSRLFCSESNRSQSRSNICWDADNAKRLMRSGLIVTDFTIWNNTGYDPIAERNQRQEQEQMKIKENQQRQQDVEKQKADDQRRKEEEQRRRNEQEEQDKAERLREQRNDQNNNLRKQTEDANNAVMEGFNQAVMSGEKTEFFDKLGYGMTFGFGMGFVQVPLVTLSTNPNFSPSSSISNASPLGGYLNSDLWLVRNKYFGVGGDSYMNLGFFTGVTGSNQTATINAFNARIQAGLKKLKLHLQYGTESRTGTVSTDFQITGGNETGSFSYDTKRLGAGIIYDFSNKDNGDSFVSYSLLLDRPDFLPKSYDALKVHKLWVRSYIDIILYYSNNYPIAGIPEYPVNKSNEDFIMVSFSKTFTLFKGNYKK